jgi:multiple sugar transport system substrate-binding protein
MSKRVLTTIALAGGAALGIASLSGCGGSAGAQSGKVEIRHSFFGNYQEWRMWQTIAKEFEAANPGIKMKLLYWPGNYEDKLKLLMAAGRAPDVMSAQDEPFPAYCERGQFEDLSRFIAREPQVYQPDLYFPTSLDVFQYKGRQHALPWNGGMVMMYYNRALFREAGLPEPRRDWTWEEFMTACRALSVDKNGDGQKDQYGFEVPTIWFNLMPFLWSAGGDILNDTMTRSAIDSPGMRQGLALFQDMRFKEKVAPGPADFANMGGGVMFMTGRLGMQPNGPWGLPFMRETGVDWDIAHMPVGPAGRYTRATWDGLAMASTSKHKEEAWRWIRWVTTEKGQYHVAQTGRAIPPLRSQAYSPSFIRPDTPQHEERFLEAMEMKYIRIQDMNPAFAEIDQVLREETEKLLLNTQDPEKTMKVSHERINTMLKKRYPNENQPTR